MILPPASKSRRLKGLPAHKKSLFTRGVEEAASSCLSVVRPGQPASPSCVVNAQYHRQYGRPPAARRDSLNALGTDVIMVGIVCRSVAADRR